MFKSANDLIKLIGGNRARSLYVFNLDGLDILRQLRFEEFIYRNASPVAHNSSFFLVNGSHIDRSVVFGLSGNPSDFVKDFKFCKDSGIKLIKRFSGGGTVLIDENTVTSSFIATHSFAPSLMANQICKWTFDNVYNKFSMFKANFALVDGDFVVRMPTTTSCNGSLTSGNNSTSNSLSNDGDDHVYFKVGGNAQAFSKHSFVHHTCFVWQVSPLIDKVLLIPRRMPKYRRNRDHGLFLQSVSQCLSDNSATRADFSKNLRESINLNAVETFSFKYRPLAKVDNFELNDEFFDDCLHSLNKPNTNQITF
ncbi:lipoate--protein ligase [Theileria orientalis]|uniref:Lipoate--protein ligase n=1 Tax=Theileria orientalis TaxID=68886 RepID=A0A976MDN9_THEOR|nr:lipoate--protein ligase [Theileria orientalis]